MCTRPVGAPPDDRFKFAYEQVANYPSETMFPPYDDSVLKGTVDFHVHAGKRRIDPVAQMKHASRAGMRAVVFKNAQNATVDLARTTNLIVQEWCEAQAVEPAEAFGGVVLGTLTGGVNVELVRYQVGLGAKIVWLPVLTSAQHLEKARGLPREEALRRGVRVIEGGKLLPEVVDVIRIVADADVVLSLGHLSPEEMRAVAEEVERQGYRKAIVDHPFDPPLELTEQDLYDLVRAGLTLNFTWFELSQFVGIDPRDVGVIAKNAGVGRVILSSDGCLPIFPDSVESLRMLGHTMAVLGFDASQVEAMRSLNSCALLNIEPTRAQAPVPVA